jgi:methionyl-tRNA formyltransferase
MKKETRFIFFGSSTFSVEVLDTLETLGLSPVAVVTLEDKPKGRKLILTENPVKVWAKERNIKVVEKIDGIQADVFVVASYGKILSKEIIYTPKFKTLNIHPSLLPKLRGPSPIQSAIIGEEKTGVSIMLLDEKMDHGPVLAQKEISFSKWPDKYTTVEKRLAVAGAELLAEVLPKWLVGEIEATAQDESGVTVCKMIKKEDGNISKDSPETALRKVYAYEIWPRAFTFYKRADGKEERLVITDAHLAEGKLIYDRVIPEGKREMSWAEFLRGNK